MSELTNEQIAAGAAVLGDDGHPVGRNTAIMVADAMFSIQSPAPIPEQVAQITFAERLYGNGPDINQRRDALYTMALIFAAAETDSAREATFEDMFKEFCAVPRIAIFDSLTRHTGAEVATNYTFETEEFFEVEAVERLLATQSAKQGAQPSVLDHICDLFGIGALARSESTILANVRNVIRREECLSAIERTFFMVPAEPDEDFPDEDPGEECMLGWGRDPQQYVEQFRAALKHVAVQASVEQATGAQEVTQQAAKAETAEQANVLPPTRGTDSQHNADPYDVIEFALELAENKGNQDAMDFLAAWWWETNDDFLRVHWPDFAKLELASRCRAQGGNTNTESSDLAPTTSTVSASGNSSKNSSSSEGDQAAVDDVRNQALEEAVEAADAAYLSAQCSIERGEFSQPIRQTREAIEAAIRALRTTPTAAQAAADKSED